MTQILIFLLGLLINFISGIKNAFFYANKKDEAVLFGIILFVLMAVSSYTITEYMFSITKIQGINISIIVIVLWCMFFISMFGGCAFMIYMFETGDTNHGKRIHIWEAVIQYSWFILMSIAGIDLVLLLCIALAGNVLFNIPIQYGATGNLINAVSATDDPTGKTEGIWIFGHEFKKPRISNGYVMLAIGIAATIFLFVYIYKLHWSITVYSIIDWLESKL